MDFTDIINDLTDIDRKILRAFGDLRKGGREVEGSEFAQYIKTDDIAARRDGPLGKVLLIFPSGACCIPMGNDQKERFGFFWNAFEKDESARGKSKRGIAVPSVTSADGVRLLSWQANALAKWEAAGQRGIVEAVTGTGKTYLGMGIIHKLETSGQRFSPLIVVPTIPIMEQWCEKLSRVFPGKKVATIGGGTNGDFSSPLTVAVVAVINSLVLNQAKKLNELLDHCRMGSTKSLLIADECHHYAEAPVFSKLLQFPFDWTLGLSATVGRYEVPGLGRVICEYKFQDACRDGLIPPFDLVNVDMKLTTRERQEYLDLDRQIKDAHRQVLLQWGFMLAGLYGDAYWDCLRAIMGKFGSRKAPEIERLFLLYFKQAAISYTAGDKIELAERIVEYLVREAGKKVLVFFERIASAEQVGEHLANRVAEGFRERLCARGRVSCSAYHSQMPRAKRSDVLDRFRKSGPSALLACRSLDEGLDIPNVDAAVLVASTQSVRTRIQRIGRVLRRGANDKRSLIVTLVIRGTSDHKVISEDATLFEGVAPIYPTNRDSCLQTIARLHPSITPSRHG